MKQVYKGNVTPEEAWEQLHDSDAYLVDVRTSAELHYVGYPDLNNLKKKLITLEWRTLPRMNRNTDFTTTLKEIIPDTNSSILFLCRTGGRSMEAAIEMTLNGYLNCYNITSGFEGDLDNKYHRGNISGWKASNLPWRQE